MNPNAIDVINPPNEMIEPSWGNLTTDLLVSSCTLLASTLLKVWQELKLIGMTSPVEPHCLVAIESSLGTGCWFDSQLYQYLSKG